MAARQLEDVDAEHLLIGFLDLCALGRFATASRRSAAAVVDFGPWFDLYAFEAGGGAAWDCPLDRGARPRRWWRSKLRQWRALTAPRALGLRPRREICRSCGT